MDREPRPMLDVVGVRTDYERSVRLARRGNGLWARISGPEPGPVEATVYWPVMLIDATAETTTLRHRAWRRRVATAADLVTGRIGVVDVDLPDTVAVDPTGAHVLAPRWGEPDLRGRWRDFFRDYVARRYRPLRAPRLTIDRTRRVWLPYHVVPRGQRRLLVDLVTGRADPLETFPEVAELLDGDATCPVPHLSRGATR